MRRAADLPCTYPIRDLPYSRIHRPLSGAPRRRPTLYLPCTYPIRDLPCTYPIENLPYSRILGAQGSALQHLPKHTPRQSRRLDEPDKYLLRGARIYENRTYPIPTL